MEKGHLTFWIYSCFLVVTLSCLQCTHKEDARTTEVKNYLNKQYNIKLDQSINKIYVVNDIGCGNCILSFSESIKNHVNDNRALIIINSRGINVDLDAFENKKSINPNVIIKHSIINDPKDLFYNSSVVYIEQEKVDTIININGEDIVNQLQYIFNRK